MGQDEPSGWPWPTGERWLGRFENRAGDELRRRRSGRELADEPRVVCARAIQRLEANRGHDHLPTGRDSTSVVDFWQRPAGNRHKARKTECGPSSVFERRQWRAVHYNEKRQGLLGSAECPDGGEAGDSVFHRGEDAPIRIKSPAFDSSPAGLASASATLRPPSGPQGWECSPLLAHLSGFERTLFAFARNAAYKIARSPGNWTMMHPIAHRG